MIKVLNNDGTIFEIIKNYNFQEFEYGNINQIEVGENPDKYIGKIFYIYESGSLISSGICEKYSYDKGLNNGYVDIYPLFYDLRRDFFTDDLGNLIVYKNDTFENILTEIIGQYREKCSNPILYLKNPLANSGSTGINIKYTFNYKTFLDCFNILFFNFLPMEKSIFIHPDGGIEIINTPTERKMNYGNDVKIINYSKKTDEIINYIIFDNKLPGDGHILKTYEDTTSIANYGKRVKYWDDGRVQYEETADEMVSTFFSKYANPTIEVNDIITDNSEVGLYDKITINNWDKTFNDNIFVIGISYLKNGFKKLRVGTKLTRSILSIQDDLDSISETMEAITTSIPTLPDYIQETYIDSTEIRSPNIAGNTGYFSGLMKVGSSGIDIDGVNKIIKSSNYSSGSAGWKIDNDGNAEFNDATLRGDFVAGSININNQFTVDSSGNARGNNFTNKTIFFEKLGSTPSVSDGKMWCEGNPTNKVLWGYFGGDSNKQQISTSRMQYSSAFDRTSNASYTYTTWFQPRLLIFNGFFEKTSEKIYGTTNGQAGSVSSSQGFCNSTKLKFSGINSIQNISATIKNNVVSDLSFTSSGGNLTSASWNNNNVLNSYSWNYETLDAITEIYTAAISNSFATDSVSKNCYAYVSSWSNTGVTIQVIVPTGWRLGGTFTIFG